VSIDLDHTIVPSRQAAASAQRLAGLLGVPWAAQGIGPFSPVYLNDGTTLDFIQTDEDFPVYHFAFRVDDARFDAILARLRAAGIAWRSTVRGPVDGEVDTRYGGRIAYWNEPDGHQWEILTVSYARAPAPAGFDDPAGTWNRRFEAEGYLFGTAPNAWLAAHAGVWQPGQHVLCVADGEGRNSVHLARLGLQVQAFDIAEVGVAKARRLAAGHGVQVDFQVADCDAYDWPVGTLDGVAAIFVQFADPAMRARLFARMAAALKPGGVLLLLGYTPKQLDYNTGGPPCVAHLYTEDLLRAAFAGLQIDELRAYEDEIDEGAAHRGRSALIGLVVRRR